MRRNHGWGTGILVLAATAVALITVASLTPGVTPAFAEDADAGQEIFLAQKCNTCHGVEAVGIEAKVKSEKMMGPDLTNVATERDAEWLFWLDTDMGFLADTLERLIEVADPVERPIVGALCFTQRETSEDGMGGWRCAAAPTIFDWIHQDDQQGFAVRWDYPVDTLTRCAGTGSACVLVHRSVYERVYEKYGRSWYDKAFNPTMRKETSEDLSFCMRAVSVGVPVHVHTGVRTSHQKTIWLSEDDYLAQRPLVPPPATEETAALGPVLNPPQNAAPFMRSLRASTGLAKAYAIADSDDDETVAAWIQAGATVIKSTGGLVTFAKKVNAGYQSSSEPWLFMVGDDARFHPGCLDHAQAMAGDRFHVVGHSMTGMATQRIALDATARVKSAIAVCAVSAAGFPMDDETWGFFSSRSSLRSKPSFGRRWPRRSVANCRRCTSNPSSGISASTSPRRRALRGRRLRPVRIMSSASGRSMSRGNRVQPPQPGRIPSLISGTPIFESGRSEITR